MARQVDLIRRITDRVAQLGSPVVYDPGWERRGAAALSSQPGLTDHHTATAGNCRRVIRDGHGRLPGPLATWTLELDGTLVAIAAGRANHAGRGGFRGMTGNGSVLGLEIVSPGDGTPLTPAQVVTLDRLHHAAVENGVDVDGIHSHAEWTPRKTDPIAPPHGHGARSWDMAAVRDRIRNGFTDDEEDDMAPDAVVGAIEYEGGLVQLQYDGGTRFVNGARWPHGRKQAFSYQGLPAGARREPPGRPRRFPTILRDALDVRRRGFSIISTRGEQFRFPYPTRAA